MLYSGFVGLTIILAIAAVYFGLKLVGRGEWLIAWIRGTVGLTFFVGAIFLLLMSLDLLSYQQLLNQKVLGTISFSKQADQEYTGTLTLVHDNTETNYIIHGDQWQIDARIISWTGFLKVLGAKPGYRLDRLSGRYYSLEDEHRKPRSVHALDESQYWLDSWSLLQNSEGYIPLIDATYGSATYLPMEDGAFYQISLSANGLLATPMNDVAIKAIERWR